MQITITISLRNDGAKSLARERKILSNGKSWILLISILILLGIF